MTAEYEITADDLVAFNLYHHRQSPTARRQYLRSWLGPAAVWLCVCAGLWYFADRHRGTPLRTLLDLLPLFSGVPVYLLYFPWAYRRKLRKIIHGMVTEGRNRGMLGRHRVTISPEGVAEASEHAQTSTHWRGVEKVVATAGHAFIYIGAMAAVIVPRRAFADPADFDKFLDTAQQHHQPHQAG